MVTLNVAEHFRLDHLVGSLSPGKMADLVIIPSPENYSPQLVMCEGKTIFKDGKNRAEPKKVSFPDDYVSYRRHSGPAFSLHPIERKSEGHGAGFKACDKRKCH